ncbi:FAD-binding and (Fe-S)-binding domain-containing protein [Gordonia sp. SL306]|uniref:FAD-binding and (Fe-S)-binding domain-containing protein n=1 Tax=Gordonia sp. SL306 TaxID=2995145 RepID=UPI00226E4BE9|nr:FAD-binding and (Fe-S)-binding domain-containing protein [Gordonia sp. SL306]WAC56990.1 FAD-binding and (Fe-S)-binding domain-containing protein [Gordonia sp. SL306]
MTHAPTAGGTQTDVAGDLDALGVEVDSSSRRLAEYSYDASNYRIRPVAVVFPRDADDVARTVSYCHSHRIPLIPRGGGTSMGGNAIGPGIVMDLSRYMNRVLSVDTESGTAVAESGIVLTTLAAQARAATDGRLTFAPDPSSASRATLGGAIGNDACGNHSVRHGRTTDHVEELFLVTADGRRLTATRHGIEATDHADEAAVERAAELTRRLRDLAARHMAILRTDLETIPRQVSGYHLAKLLPENGFDVARALVGSEGTCAVVVGARVRLVPVAASPLLICVGYPTVSDAARDIPAILPYAPSAVEGIDRKIVATMAARRGRETVSALPGVADRDCTAWLFIDIDEQSATRKSETDVGATAKLLLDDLRSRGRMIAGTTVPDPVARKTLWRVREDGAGLSSRLADPDDESVGADYESWPGWEDAAVAPERLADYLDEFTDLLDRHHLTGVMYGHFGAGCMHVRITFDLRSAEGRAVMDGFCTDAARLVVAHGGSLSGEHGDGRARSALLPIMYTPAMLSTFAEFKQIWDPQGTLNPGSIVDPPPITDDLALAGVPPRTWPTMFQLGVPGPSAPGAAPEPPAPPAPGAPGKAPQKGALGTSADDIMSTAAPQRADFGGGFLEISEIPRGAHTTSPDPFVHAVQGCIGVGRCRSTSGGVMCPSYRATRDEKDSTRGRARVLQDMVRTAPDVETGWQSTDVAEALDLCLSCKACSTDCPTGVDMATYKSEFLHHHYRGRRRPMSHYSLGWMPAWLGVAGTLAPAINAALKSPLRRLAARTGGLDPRRSMPRFATRRDRRTHLRALAPVTAATDTVLFVDSFTKAFRPHVATAAAEVLGSTGDAVGCSADNCCALTWISTGQLTHARKVLSRTAEHLDDGTDRPIVVPEPSCAAALRKDLPELVQTDAAHRVSSRVHSFADHLSRLVEAGWRPEGLPEAVTLQTHCHEHAVFGATTGAAVLQSLGVEVHTADGCCGVAGNFGFEQGHYEVSVAVAEHALAPALRSAPDRPVITDGFSCAMSVDHLTATDPAISSTGLHIAELLTRGATTPRPPTATEIPPTATEDPPTETTAEPTDPTEPTDPEGA